MPKKRWRFSIACAKGVDNIPFFSFVFGVCAGGDERDEEIHKLYVADDGLDILV